MKKLRFEVYPKFSPALGALQKSSRSLCGDKLLSISLAKTYYIESQAALSLEEQTFIASKVLSDSVTEEVFSNKENLSKYATSYIEVLYKPGVTDNSAFAIAETLKTYFPEAGLSVSTGKLYSVEGDLSQQDLQNLTERQLCNKLLQNYYIYSGQSYLKQRDQFFYMPKVCLAKKEDRYFDFSQNIEVLEAWSKENYWALSLEELLCIQNLTKSEDFLKEREEKGLPTQLSDVEVEILAQTWSEHCKHKLFNSEIHYTESPHGDFHRIGEKHIKSLFKDCIKKSTDEISRGPKKDQLVSVFTDNAGIVNFDPHLNACIKVETHNSPSALDPYGGALTGILGVNRDILGTGMGARPVANMDVFCVADKSLAKREPLPISLLDPSYVLNGVHKGVEDGGNKSGIPTINGSMLFDDNYAGKPLVFVGTLGLMPKSNSFFTDTSKKHMKAGDRVVVAGGRVGVDGIHGATFSSVALDDSPPSTAVQIGDPFTQKRLTDFTLAARDLGLYSSITDNGAGGISSSVGEMAELSGGACIDLDKLLCKYPGLSNYEKMISESQERMTFSVPPKNLDRFLELASEFHVEAQDIGEFTSTGYLEVFDRENQIAHLALEFLHHGLPKMSLKATYSPENHPWGAWHKKQHQLPYQKDLGYLLEHLLKSPNIASKESMVRSYDHEVKAATIGKLFEGSSQSGPTDAGVIDLEIYGGSSENCLALSNGNQSLLSKVDSYHMAIASFDEAVRNQISSGVSLEEIVVLDNFCWPDPIASKSNPDGEHKLAQLVRSAKALYDISTHYQCAFVSGKDSMKNDFYGKSQSGEEIKISVPPSLLVTALGRLDKKNLTPSCFPDTEEFLVYSIGNIPTDKFLHGEVSRLFEVGQSKDLFEIDLESNKKTYVTLNTLIKNSVIQSCHDISEGGLVVALVESCFGNRVGFRSQVSANEIPFWVNECLASFVVSIPRSQQQYFESFWSPANIRLLGHSIPKEKQIHWPEFSVSLAELERYWKEPVNG